MSDIKIFSGNSNINLAKEVSRQLGTELGSALVSSFSDGETQVAIEENVRGKNVFIIQPTSYPVNDYVMELVIMSDAIRRASARSITAVVPYFGYARQDRRVRSARVPISAKVVADMLASVGITRMITVDLHADQIQGFFDMPVDNVYASKAMLSDMQQHTHGELTVVSPDVGGVVRARAIAKILVGSDLAIIDKRRDIPNQSEVLNVIGDVRGKCVIIDDIIDTAGTICSAAAALKERGAQEVVAYCTHPVLSGQAVQKIVESELDELIITDTINVPDRVLECVKIRQISLAGMLAETIMRVHGQRSVSEMFD